MNTTDRVGNPSAATLIRAINSVSALEAVLLHLFSQKYKVSYMSADSGPILCQPLEDGVMEGGCINWCWELPDERNV
ncbi:MAG: hypothetical protein OEZ47_15680 [Gammaproteobacteria bacterium]|nr:hypothetical protein [Gammaproteobacteria bacterium]